jgi:single-strand DNA-binding protein
VSSKATISIIGNVGKDPETRDTSGGPVCSFSVAVQERKDDPTTWFRVSCFGKTAEIAQRFVTKGKQVAVDGRFQMRAYKDKNGVEKTSAEIAATGLTLLGSKDEDKAAPSKSAPAKGKPVVDDDADLPF